MKNKIEVGKTYKTNEFGGIIATVANIDYDTDIVALVDDEGKLNEIGFLSDGDGNYLFTTEIVHSYFEELN